MNNSQEMASTIKTLAKSKSISIKRILEDCGLNKNSLFTMQSNGFLPRLESIGKIADYLDCSVDYLLGRTDNPEAHKTQNSYSISNQDTIVNGTQANVIHNDPIDSEVWELAQLIKSLPIVKRAEAILAVEEIKNK